MSGLGGAALRREDRAAAYRIVGELSDAHIDTLVRLYQSEWWSKGRREADVRKMLSNSDIVVGLVETRSDKLVGFARVITDRVYRGTIYDVIVAGDLRGNDLGKMLMDALTSHPDLKDIESLELHCLPDLEPFYAKWGFAPNVSGTNTLRRRRDYP
jgi:ribosomal protein S18 acetylase RimI-like enzyme